MKLTNKLFTLINFVLMLSALVLSVVFIYDNYNDKEESIAINLLNDLIYSNEDYKSILPNYLLTSENENGGIGSPGLTRDIINFDYVFGNDLYECDSYKITESGNNFVEILLLYEDKPLYPRILFVYNLNKTVGKIEDYTLARELPFSRLNEEYNKLWLD